jgi:bifunctional enzyme CysN/CysC
MTMPQSARNSSHATQTLTPLADTAREQMKIVIVGHVDHGKSSLIGRLFYETDSLPDGKFEAITASCKKRGMPFEWSFLLDALQSERDQGITIDTTQIWFKTERRDYVIIDAPGHKEFLKNMISGAASADAAILLIDAKEGVREQSKRHGYLLHLLGIRQIAVAVNKMDLVDYSQERFEEIKAEYTAYLESVGVTPSCFIPISAREGVGITPEQSSVVSRQSSEKNGTDNRLLTTDNSTILEALDAFTPTAPLTDMPLRLPVQDVYKFDERRILAGRIESGSLQVGDELLFSPSNKRTTITSIEQWPTPDTAPQKASAGQSVGITLQDQLFIERGEMISHVEDAPLLSNLFHANIVWLGDNPLREGNFYKIKLQNAELHAEVRSIDQVLDTDTLKRVSPLPLGEVAEQSDAGEGEESAEGVKVLECSDNQPNTATPQHLNTSSNPHPKSEISTSPNGRGVEIPRHGVGEVTFRVRGMAALDDHADNPKTGRFVIIEDYDVVGGGIINLQGVDNQRTAPKKVKSENIYAVEHQISTEQRVAMNGHLPGILWFTGLSGSGKSTLTQAVQTQLFAKGYQVMVLDGDNVRHGLCSDLGFSADDRSENIRRVGEVAALFARAGFIVLTAFISPYIEDRRRARNASPEHFHTVYVKASLETCEGRDIKGLYAKARAGEIKNFTGIDDPYEPPIHSDLEIETDKLSVEQSVEQVVEYIEARLVKPVRQRNQLGGGI